MTAPSRETPKSLADLLDHEDDNRSYSAKVVTYEATIRTLTARAEQAEAREKALKDSTAELRQLRRDHNALLAQRERDAEVKVKPLEWGHNDGNYPTWRCSAPVWGAMFSAVIDKGRPEREGKFPLIINGFWDGRKHQTLRSAKAAAQADYERRILSALAARHARQDAALDTLANEGKRWDAEGSDE